MRVGARTLSKEEGGKVDRERSGCLKGASASSHTDIVNNSICLVREEGWNKGTSGE